ncbi:MAG: twin-arginine translocase TatA/TatE family subunit [Phycisphaerales bacterium]|nr:twin-arginine translocase TatA/TatE family subunit [Phycisphaerales bacterium]
MNLLAILGLPGGSEWIAILLVALLLFGRRLPEVARSFGKSIVEFKKGMQDVKDDVQAPLIIEPPKAANSLPAGTTREAMPGTDPSPGAKAESKEESAAPVGR